MCQTYRTAKYVAGLVFLFVSLSYGQSLGDVARQQRQNQTGKKDQPAPKVITNDDMPEHAQDSSGEKTAQDHAAPQKSSKSAEQWKAQILGQKRTIATLQSQMEKIQASIHFVEANLYENGVQHNLRQEHKEEQVQRLQEQLDREKKRLEDMQEAARRDGYGNAVYEP